MDKITKLSQAIRLGSTFRPQAHRSMYDGFNETTCALGAAAEAAGIVDWEQFHPNMTMADVQARLWKRFPELNCTIDCKGEPDIDVWKCKARGALDLSDVIVGLNDRMNWTRERIADWLESKGL